MYNIIITINQFSVSNNILKHNRKGDLNMPILFLLLVLALNFMISWANANYVGRYWSESKEVGGSFRVYIVVGYIMAIAGFTMVYGYILLLVAPIILQIAEVDTDIILMFKRLNCWLELLCSNS